MFNKYLRKFNNFKVNKIRLFCLIGWVKKWQVVSTSEFTISSFKGYILHKNMYIFCITWKERNSICFSVFRNWNGKEIKLTWYLITYLSECLYCSYQFTLKVNKHFLSTKNKTYRKALDIYITVKIEIIYIQDKKVSQHLKLELS